MLRSPIRRHAWVGGDPAAADPSVRPSDPHLAPTPRTCARNRVPVWALKLALRGALLMIPIRYVWLSWSGLFFLVWIALMIRYRAYRPLMWWSSVLTVPFGLSEPFFLLHYWHPPSLFNLTHTVHADLETFLFCFSIGGTAAVGYHVVTGRPMVIRRRAIPDERFLAWYSAGLLVPLPAFGAILLLTGEIFWAGIAGFVAGAVARLICRPDLAVKTLVGGLLFFGYYTLLLFVLTWMAPGYIELAWNVHGPAAIHWFGLPLTELLFGLCFGLYWSGLFEQLAWLFASPERSPR